MSKPTEPKPETWQVDINVLDAKLNTTRTVQIIAPPKSIGRTLDQYLAAFNNREHEKIFDLTIVKMS